MAVLDPANARCRASNSSIEGMDTEALAGLVDAVAEAALDRLLAAAASMIASGPQSNVGKKKAASNLAAVTDGDTNTVAAPATLWRWGGGGGGGGD